MLYKTPMFTSFHPHLSESGDPEVRSKTMQSILTINGGSSSIKFALFEAGDPLRRILEGSD